jgi:DNA-binding response OmpR family regulator
MVGAPSAPAPAEGGEDYGGTRSTHVLIIDDRELCALLADFLRLEGFRTSTVHDGAEAVTHLRRHRYDAVVLDVMLPGLQSLHSRAGTVVDKKSLSREAPGRALSAGDRSIDVNVSKIRKKLSARGGERLIVSVRSKGYQFTVGGDGESP